MSGAAALQEPSLPSAALVSGYDPRLQTLSADQQLSCCCEEVAALREQLSTVSEQLTALTHTLQVPCRALLLQAPPEWTLVTPLGAGCCHHRGRQCSRHCSAQPGGAFPNAPAGSWRSNRRCASSHFLADAAQWPAEQRCTKSSHCAARRWCWYLQEAPASRPQACHARSRCARLHRPCKQPWTHRAASAWCAGVDEYAYEADSFDEDSSCAPPPLGASCVRSRQLAAQWVR